MIPVIMDRRTGKQNDSYSFLSHIWMGGLFQGETNKLEVNPPRFRLVYIGLSKYSRKQAKHSVLQSSIFNCQLPMLIDIGVLQRIDS